MEEGNSFLYILDTEGFLGDLRIDELTSKVRSGHVCYPKELPDFIYRTVSFTAGIIYHHERKVFFVVRIRSPERCEGRDEYLSHFDLYVATNCPKLFLEFVRRERPVIGAECQREIFKVAGLIVPEAEGGEGGDNLTSLQYLCSEVLCQGFLKSNNFLPIYVNATSLPPGLRVSVFRHAYQKICNDWENTWFASVTLAVMRIYRGEEYIARWYDENGRVRRDIHVWDIYKEVLA